MIRAKITPQFIDDGVKITVEWINVVEGEQIIGVVGVEEFTIAQKREGCGYVTRGGFDQGQMQPGTFWIDESGHRHFVMDAETGYVGLIGNSVFIEGNNAKRNKSANAGVL